MKESPVDAGEFAAHFYFCFAVLAKLEIRVNGEEPVFLLFFVLLYRLFALFVSRENSKLFVLCQICWRLLCVSLTATRRAFTFTRFVRFAFAIIVLFVTIEIGWFFFGEASDLLSKS